jgi:hypothetical protein
VEVTASGEEQGKAAAIVSERMREEKAALRLQMQIDRVGKRVKHPTWPTLAQILK